MKYVWDKCPLTTNAVECRKRNKNNLSRLAKAVLVKHITAEVFPQGQK